jgi:hypothetical protein
MNAMNIDTEKLVTGFFLIFSRYTLGIMEMKKEEKCM